MFQDEHQGVKTKVILQPEFDSYGIGNDSGFHSDVLSPHSSTSSSIHRDSVSSHSDDGEVGGKPLVLGMLSVAPEISWVTMDSKICDIFMVCTCIYAHTAHAHTNTLMCKHSITVHACTHTLTQHHINSVDMEGCLGLNEDSIMCYCVGEQRRQIGNALLPTKTPYEAVQVNSEIRIMMKGVCVCMCV